MGIVTPEQMDHTPSTPLRWLAVRISNRVGSEPGANRYGDGAAVAAPGRPATRAALALAPPTPLPRARDPAAAYRAQSGQ